MNLREYQQQAARTANKEQSEAQRAMIAALGLTGEAGEVADMVKKWHGHGHPYQPDALIKELGDVLWYVAEMASAHGLSLTQIAAANLLKLRRRYPEGFSTEASVARVDVEGAGA